MTEPLAIFRTASAMARHAGQRQGLVAENIAHADTPGYKARSITSFADSFEANSGLQTRQTRPGHIAAGTSPHMAQPFVNTELRADPNGNTVEIEHEILQSVEAERQQSRALAIYQSAQSILKSSIGRGR